MEFEKDIESYLKRRVEAELDGLCIKAEGIKGIPDRMLVLPPHGDVVWCELKRKGGRLSKIQEYQHAKLRRLGAEVVVVWSREDVDELISRIKDHK